MLAAAVPAKVALTAITHEKGFLPGAAVVFTDSDGIMLAGEVNQGNWLQLIIQSANCHIQLPVLL